MADEISKVKALLRSTIQSVKGGVPARNLNRDFKDITGEAIPFRKHGFSSLEEFLHSMPEVVRLITRDGELYCAAVADESTAHIEKMISRQRSTKKKSKKGGWGGMRRPVYNVRGRLGAPHRFPQRSTSYTKGYGSTPSQNRPPHRPSSGASRTIDHSPHGSVKVTFKRSPLRPTAVNSTAKPSQSDVGKFGSSYKVPPRFQRILNTSPVTFEDVREYKNLLYGSVCKKGFACPRYETISTSTGFTSIVTVLGETHDSGGVYRSKVDAEQASARSACQALGIVQGRRAGFTSQDRTQQKQKQDKENQDLGKVKRRVAELLEGRNNGLWFQRLPVLYSETFNEPPPSSLGDLIQYWPDIVSVHTHNEDLKIIYPVVKDVPPTPTTPKAPQSSRTNTRTDCVMAHFLDTPPVITRRQQKSPEPSLVEEPSVDLTSPPVATPPWRKRHASSGDFGTIFNPKMLSIQEMEAPEIGTTQSIYISFVESVDEFYVHMGDSEITKITQKLCNIHGGKKTYPVSKLVCGRYVAAKSTDELWYRAQIRTLEPPGEPQTCVVYYIDFGNTETMPVTAENVHELQSELFEWPVQALLCSLADVHRPKDEKLWSEASKELEGLDSELSIKLVGISNGKCRVKLYDGTKCVNEELQRKGLVKSAPPVDEPGPLEPPKETEWVVTVTDIISANQIMLRLLGEKYSDKLEELEELISKTPVPQTICRPEVGDLCAGMISSSTEEGDIPWYRLRVKAVSGDKATCECLDYGDSEIVPLSMLRPLLPEEAQLPFQALVAYLSGLEGCQTNETMKEQLVKLALGKSLIATVESREGDPSITLYDTATEVDVNINEALVLVTDQALVKPELPAKGVMCEVYLSHADIEGNIYIQIQGPGLLELDVLNSEVSETLSKGGAEYFVTELVEGRMVLAPFADGGWYRGTIMEVLPNRMVLLYFVDYGIQEVMPCSSLRELEKANKKLFKLPHQAIAVALDELPPPGHQHWVDRAVDELCELAPADKLIQVETITSPKDGSLPVVHLYCFELSPELEYFSINEQIAEPHIWNESPISSAADNEADVNTSLSDASVASQQANEVLREMDSLFRNLGMADTSGLLSLEMGEPRSPNAKESPQQTVITAPVCGTGENDLQFCRDVVVPDVTEKGVAGDVEPYPGQIPSSGELKIRDLNSNETQKDNPKTDEDFAALPLPPSLELPPTGSEVYVTWAADPLNFRCVTSSRLPLIEGMMDEMADFYYNEGDALTVVSPKIGGLYAGFFNDRWRRIRIKRIINQPLLGNTTMVSAQLVDLGEFSLIKSDMIRHLPSKFRQLPFQVIQASLAGVEAETGIWDEDAVQHFETLVLEKTFIAWFHEVDAGSVVSMTLVDVGSKGDDSFIHKKLVTKGYAVSSPMPIV